MPGFNTIFQSYNYYLKKKKKTLFGTGQTICKMLFLSCMNWRHLQSTEYDFRLWNGIEKTEPHVGKMLLTKYIQTCSCLLFGSYKERILWYRIKSRLLERRRPFKR